MDHEVVPFGVVSCFPSASHGDLALALGAEFEPVDAEGVDHALDLLAERIGGLSGVGADGQLLAVAQGLRGALDVEGPRHLAQVEDLLHHRVALRGAGHPLAVALVAVEAARRAGAVLGIVASPDGVYVGHPELRAPLVLDPRRGWRMVSGTRLRDDRLGWRCAHEVAAMVLARVLCRAQEVGRLDLALRAADLFLLLPVERQERQRLRVQQARVRAALN